MTGHVTKDRIDGTYTISWSHRGSGSMGVSGFTKKELYQVYLKCIKILQKERVIE